MLNLRNEVIAAYRHGRKMISQATGTDFPFNRIPRKDLTEIIASNRQCLAQIPTWLEPETLQRSIFQYGITPKSLSWINERLDERCTYADLLVYIARTLRQPLRYFELGVSVGKTFWQVLCNCKGARLVGFDIEEINPALERQLKRQSRREWPTMAGSIKKTPSSLTTYRHLATDSQVDYLCGDIFDDTAWQALKGLTFNLVFSDALHSADALQKEWDTMVSLKLIDTEECVIVWDDLDGPMHDWFLARCGEISNVLGTSCKNVKTVFVNGWLGRREGPHRIGVAIKSPNFPAQS